ncbi:hypothetical protein PSA5_12345 [Pseudomonas syringae pv. actinidiae]|nr:hypothetical protein PSA5_12345 [Pseudomonas syringae pv. actinidiae]
MPEEWKVQETQPDPMSLSPAQCDESIVKMEWAMQFERCRQAVEEAELLLTTVNAKARLNMLLKKAGWSGIGVFELGSNAMTALQMDSVSQVTSLNSVTSGMYWTICTAH